MNPFINKKVIKYSGVILNIAYRQGVNIIISTMSKMSRDMY